MTSVASNVEDRLAHRTVLVADDSEAVRTAFQVLLSLHGARVLGASSPAEALATVRSQEVDLIIQDMNFRREATSGEEGVALFRELRALHPDVPVILLTARADEVDRITGLEMGADDYLPKTFSTRELLARLRAVLRRSSAVAEQKNTARPATVSVGSLWMDPGARTAALGAAPLLFTRVEYDLLLALAKAVGRVCTREYLLLAAADRDFEAFDRSIDVHLSALRRKLADDSREPRFIETVRGLGYRMRRPGEVA